MSFYHFKPLDILDLLSQPLALSSLNKPPINASVEFTYTILFNLKFSKETFCST